MSATPKVVRKRKRENEVKKWTHEELKMVLSYMQAHRNICKPTARIYYEKLLEETKIYAHWGILKCKVQYLKGTLEKAEAWCKASGIEMENGKCPTSIKEKVVYKICPHYDQLSDLFSTNKKTNVTEIDTSSDIVNCISQDAIDIKEEYPEVSDDTQDNYSPPDVEVNIKDEYPGENYDIIEYGEADTNDIKDENIVVSNEEIASSEMDVQNTSHVRNETRKRKRENEVKKWTDEDIKTVLSYMQTHRNIEKPTARIYYEKLLAETKIEGNWNILKCKVRHLRGTLQKAVSWSKTAGARLEDGECATSIKEKVVYKICPHYDQLSDIFSTAMYTSYDAFDSISHDSIDNKDENFDVSDDTYNCSANDAILIKNESLIENDDAYDYGAAPHAIDVRDENLVVNNKIATSSKAATSLVNLTPIEIERTKFWEKQLKLDYEKFEWAKEVEMKKLEIERMKLENEFQLKKLELEQNERIKMFEIEMKYKNNK